jgi:hypothetical protein
MEWRRMGFILGRRWLRVESQELKGIKVGLC